MNYKTIDEIFAANDAVHERLKQAVASLSEEQAARAPAGENWSIAQIVEHVSLVNEGTTRICERLLRKALEAGRVSNGEVAISKEFLRKGRDIETMKVSAPERVAPINGQSVARSLDLMEDSGRRLAELRPLFERNHSREFTFAHPFFGDICAQEWLMLAGAHEKRHLRQIERILGGDSATQNDPGYEEGEITGA